MSKINTDTVEPSTGTSLTLGASGDTISIPAGATIANSGTATGFGGDNTPSFSVTIAASQNFSDSTWTKVEWDTEVWDTDSAFDSTTHHLSLIHI